ncbi:DUF1993 family protein [bacterium]|nr:DUF1993 family protein [bacterium]
MTISMYQASVPVFTQMLQALSAILKKAALYAENRKFDSNVLVNARLYPDMFPLLKQIQIATDTAKGCAARLAGVEPPVFQDGESSLTNLTDRVDKTIEYLKTLKKEDIDGSEDKTITYTLHGKSSSFKGLPFLLHKSLPNFFFHVTTAYAILRHNGLEIGKADYIGTF